MIAGWQQLHATSERLFLRPLTSDDFQALYAVARDPGIWALHPEPLRWQQAVFSGFFAKACGDGALIVIERESGAIVGSSRYYEWRPELREVAIGYTFLARHLWGGAANAELKKMMLDQAFEYVDRVWFHIGIDNLRSRRAMEKIGGEFDRVESRFSGGAWQPTAFYRIDRRAWQQTVP